MRIPSSGVFLVGLIIHLVIISGNCVDAQCLVANPNVLLDTSDDCADPKYDRALGSQTITWHGVKYLFVNVGNDIRVFDARTKKRVAESRFEKQVGHFGDSDLDLLNFSVCDECRYGVANYKKATVLFDLGELSVPRFSAPRINFDAISTPGAFTFSHAGVQYLIASDLIQSCGIGKSTLYEFSGIDESTGLRKIGCIDTGQIVGGYYVNGYLYLGDKNTRVYIFEVRDGSPITLQYLGSPWISYMIKDKGLSIDYERMIAVEAISTGMHIWDISTPGAPIKVSTTLGDFNRSTVKWPIAFAAKKGFKQSERTFDISNLAAPIEFDAGFWDASQPWNWGSSRCSEIQSGAIIDDDLYLMRYARMQFVDVSGCSFSQIFSDGFESGTTEKWQ